MTANKKEAKKQREQEKKDQMERQKKENELRKNFQVRTFLSSSSFNSTGSLSSSWHGWPYKTEMTQIEGLVVNGAVCLLLFFFSINNCLLTHLEETFQFWQHQTSFLYCPTSVSGCRKQHQFCLIFSNFYYSFSHYLFSSTEISMAIPGLSRYTTSW